MKHENMKYTARFVYYSYDEFDTTHANVFDIFIDASEPFEAFKKAEEILKEQIKRYSSFGSGQLVSLIGENKIIYILSNNQLVVLPREDYDKLPKSFCYDGETFFVITDKDSVPAAHLTDYDRYLKFKELK